MTSQVEEEFSEFYEKWLYKHEANLQELLRVERDLSHEQQHHALISKVMTHYKEYYTAKWAAAHKDTIRFFNQPWLSPLENAYLWMTGWKPSLLFRLIESLRHSLHVCFTELSEEQLNKIHELQMKISLEEEKVEREMERQQVSMADRQIVQLARVSTHVKNGEVGDDIDGLVEVALNKLLAGLERVMKMADCVRLKAFKSVLEILNPIQSVDFLATLSMLQIQLRKWGKNRYHHS